MIVASTNAMSHKSELKFANIRQPFVYYMLHITGFLFYNGHFVIVLNK